MHTEMEMCSHHPKKLEKGGREWTGHPGKGNYLLLL